VTGGAPICNAGVCGATCNLTGTFALKVTLQATWPNATYTAAGSGTFTFWLRLQGTHNGNSLTGTLTDCGRDVPPFDARTVSETFKYGHPNSIFDMPLPGVAATATLSSASPGAALTLPSSALLMGTTMADPINGAWPAQASGLAQVDTDGDGLPGVRATYQNGGGYIHPRTGGTFGDPRADTAFTASRLVFSLNGSLTSCTQSSGPASVTHIDTRIFDCGLAGGGSTADCSASQASFLDVACVSYTLGTAAYTLVKVADAATCVNVRAALP
jgi:hypothetical protein